MCSGMMRSDSIWGDDINRYRMQIETRKNSTVERSLLGIYRWFLEGKKTPKRYKGKGKGKKGGMGGEGMELGNLGEKDGERPFAGFQLRRRWV